jgi:hypothetical protein
MRAKTAHSNVSYSDDLNWLPDVAHIEGLDVILGVSFGRQWSELFCFFVKMKRNEWFILFQL